MLKPADIDAYISAFMPEIQEKLQQMRATIHKAAPLAEETISYGMPAFKQNGIVVWFAGFKSHIGFYPRPSGIEAFRNELAPYKLSKGAVQFPMDRPLPLELVAQITEFRVQENLMEKEKK